MEGMRDVDGPPPPVGAVLHQLAALERLQPGRRAGPEQPELQRPATATSSSSARGVRVHAVDPQVDQLGQARPDLHRAAPAPHAAVLGQLPAVEPVPRQLAQEQGVAAGQRPHRRRAGAVDRPAQPGRQQPVDLLARQLAQLQHGHSSSFQSARSASGTGSPRRTVTAAKASPRRHELVHERRRRVVEELPVVDAQHEPAAGGALGEHVRARARSSTPSGRPAGSSGAKAPSGIEAAERVARTQATVQPWSSASAAISVASRVFPTPAAPATTTPPAAPPPSAAAAEPSSASRPASGQRMRGV